MIFFPNKILKRYSLISEELDTYKAVEKKYVYIDDVVVDFQNENNEETLNTYGTDRQNIYKIYFPLNTVINDTDELRDDEGHRYQIIGNIEKYNHFLNYQKATLKLKRY